MNLVALDANQPPDRFYLGGEAIDAFRGVPRGPDRRPEDWVASTTTLAGEPALGLSRLPDGRLLKDAVAAEPEAWLGAEHIGAHGAHPALLVKLLHAGQRLPVHAHPDDAFAATHLHLPSGKAEAWYLLSGGTVHVGLRRDVSAEELAALVAAQDVDALLGLLHRRDVDAGTLVYVPPGVLHAIGAGILLVELQQPADLSILLEWDGFALDGESDGHLGIGFDRALEAVERMAREPEPLIVPFDEVGRLPLDAGRYFRLERVRVRGDLARVDAGFAVLIVVAGTVRLAPEHGDILDAPAGTTIVAPHDAGEIEVSGDGTLLVARPPRA